MYEICVSGDFSSAHNLRGYQGQCEALHGHNWKVEVCVRSRKLNRLGMVEDFKTLRLMLRDILSHFDHHYLNDVGVFKKINPTSENIAAVIFDEMSKRLKSRRSVAVAFVRVWETERCCATYRKS